MKPFAKYLWNHLQSICEIICKVFVKPFAKYLWNKTLSDKYLKFEGSITSRWRQIQADHHKPFGEKCPGYCSFYQGRWCKVTNPAFSSSSSYWELSGPKSQGHCIVLFMRVNDGTRVRSDIIVFACVDDLEATEWKYLFAALPFLAKRAPAGADHFYCAFVEKKKCNFFEGTFYTVIWRIQE